MIRHPEPDIEFRQRVANIARGCDQQVWYQIQTATGHALDEVARRFNLTRHEDHIDAALLELKGLIMNGFHGRDGQRALEIVQQLMGPAEEPDWPPAATAIGLAEGVRRHGSTGQCFEVKQGRWERVR